MERLVRNSSFLLVGNGAALVLTFAALALVARALGIREFGVFVLIQTYVLVMDKVFNFQSWQMLIKYGAEAIENDDTDGFRGFVKVSYILDFSSAVVSIAVANALITYVHDIIRLDAEYVTLLRVYSVIIIFNLTGTPTALLRILDRFGLYCFYQFVLGAARITAVVAVFLIDPAIGNFIFAYAGAEIFGYLFLFVTGALVLSRSGIKGVRAASLDGVRARFSELSSFVVTTNLNGTVRMLSREVDILLVGSILGTSAVGLYKIAKQIASLPIFITDPMYNAIYPEFSRLWASRDIEKFKGILRGTVKYAFILSVMVWVGFFFFGEVFIDLVFGDVYTQAYWPALFYMLAVLIGAVSFPFAPAMLAVGLHAKMFWILTFSTLVYFAFLYTFTVSGGLNGATASYLFFYVIWLVLTFYFLRKKRVL